jgi:hypothetical protein
MTDSYLPTAATTAAAVRIALREKKTALADRLITELFGRVINADGEIPSSVLERPDSTGDERYDTLLATGLAYALRSRGLPVEPWMEAVPPLNPEWLWDGDDDSSPEYRQHIRGQTPSLFLTKGLLLRERDLRIL